MKEEGVKSVEEFQALDAEKLLAFMTKEAQRASADDDLSTIKARTMYKMVEEVHDSKTGSNRKLLFLSSKQADLIARDPSAIDKMLAIFLDKQQPRMVINLLPSMIRGWMRVRPLPGDPDGEREGVAALDRFMAEHIIPLAEKTHAIILCSAVQPFCVLSDSLSRMVRIKRARWGSKLPFTIISCTSHVAHLYRNQRDGATWSAIRELSKVWQERQRNGLFAGKIKAEKESSRNIDENIKEFDMDLDPNGTNFIMVDPDSSCTSYDSYNRLVTEIARKLASDLPSIAIKTGKSKVLSTINGTDASGIEVALSNTEVGTPVLLLDLTKRLVMPSAPSWYYYDPSSNAQMGPVDGATLRRMVGKGVLSGNTPVTDELAPPPTTALATAPVPASDHAAARKTIAALIHPVDEESGPAARRRQIEWYWKQVEEEDRRRIKTDVPDYDWDVCMIAHFHDGASYTLERSTTQHALRTHVARTARATRLVRGTVLLYDGDYQSFETPTTKVNSRTREKLWQAIERVNSGYPLVTDDEMPRATAEQVCVHVAQSDCRLTLRTKPNLVPTCCRQIEDVAEWLAEMGRRADWMSGGSNFGVDVATVRKQWEARIIHPVEGPKEAKRIAARKQRLVILLGSDDCYSANLHANTNNLGEFIHSLVRLDRLPAQTPPEGLKLLVRAWDEHRSKWEQLLPGYTACCRRHGLFWRVPWLVGQAATVQKSATGQVWLVLRC